MSVLSIDSLMKHLRIRFMENLEAKSTWTTQEVRHIFNGAVLFALTSYTQELLEKFTESGNEFKNSKQKES